MEPTLAWKYSSAGSHRNEVQITKITRSLSGGTSAAIGNGVVLDNNLVSAGTPGSPYRTSLLNGIGVTKTNLNKDLMHKLRSMTETIKMLSKENEALLTKNNHLRQYKTMNETNTASYDEKVKALSEEISNLQRNQNQLQARSGVNVEAEVEIHTVKSNGDKDKYKALARRLKEERNHFRDTCEEKQREQSALKVEMEKMSVIISELRDECHKLEQELLYARQSSRESNSVGVQVSIQSKVISQPPSRRTSTTSSIITQEAMKRAQSVYGPKGKLKQKLPASVRNGQFQNSSSSSSVVSLKDVEEVSLRLRPLISTRSAATSPNKPSPLSVKSSPQIQRAATGPTIARPVTRVAQTPAKSIHPQSPVVKSTVNTPSPSRAASSNRIPVSSTISSCSFSTPSRVLSPSRIPSPKARTNRIPSAPKYKPPVRSIEAHPQTHPQPKVFTPPPPPPSTAPQEEEPSASSSSALSRNSTFSRDTAVSRFVQSLEQTPKFMTPPPAPPQSRADTDESKKSLNETRTLLSNDEEGDDEILCVHPDGQMEILPSSQMSNRTLGHSVVSPLPKSSFEDLVVTTRTSTPSKICMDELAKNENLSADDEGSRDGEDPGCNRSNFSSPFSTFTPKTKKRVESFKQGLAARRIQRTWKHFYQELEDRRALCANELQEHFKPQPELEPIFQDDLMRSPSIRSSSSESKVTEHFHLSLSTKSTSPTIKSDDRPVSSASSRGSSTMKHVSAILEANDLRMKTLSKLKSIAHVPKSDVKVLPVDNLKRTDTKPQASLDKATCAIQSVFEAHNLRRLIFRNLRTEYGRFSD